MPNLADLLNELVSTVSENTPKRIDVDVKGLSEILGMAFFVNAEQAHQKFGHGQVSDALIRKLTEGFVDLLKVDTEKDRGAVMILAWNYAMMLSMHSRTLRDQVAKHGVSPMEMLRDLMKSEGIMTTPDDGNGDLPEDVQPTQEGLDEILRRAHEKEDEDEDKDK